MIDESQVQQLLEKMVETDATPETVCADHPELLFVVKKRWQMMLRVEADLNELFPYPDEPLPQVTDRATLPKIPGYEVDEVLGHGGMGIVFGAWHLRLNRRVALKMGLMGAFAGLRERDRFQREAEAVAKLRHPNVVQIYDVGDSEGRPYFTMEFVDGGSLAQKLSGTPLQPHEAARLVAILAGAVQAAHSCGIVHRDLKPANVLLTSDGTPKITDFGLARSVDDGAGLTLTGIALGTPSYMAPEQARGHGDALGPSADVYALGAILYESLTGRPPFRGATPAETVQQVMEQDPVPPSRLNPGIPRDLQTVCLKCLQKNPRSRYSSATALQDELNRFLHGEAVSARPEGWLGWTIRRIRRQPKQAAILAISAVLAVSAIAGGAWLLWERESLARATAASLAATELAAQQDLDEVVESLKKSDWKSAEASLERAKARLGERVSVELRQSINDGERDLTLARKLDQLRMTFDSFLEFRTYEAPFEQLITTPFDQESIEQFQKAGMGQAYDDPATVAERIRTSNIREALIDALDNWGMISKDDRLRKWLIQVAKHADDDPTGWRNRVRDEAIAMDKQALLELADSVKVEEHRVPVLLILSKRMLNMRIDTEPYLRRVQNAHPNDVWVNVHLIGSLILKSKSSEAAGFMRVVLSLRPDSSIFHLNAAQIFLGMGSRDEGLYHLRRAYEIDPDALQIRQNVGLMLSRYGMHDEALAHLSRAVEQYPDFEQVHRAYGRSLMAQGREAEAMAEFRRAAELAPQTFDLLQDLWRYEMKMKRPAEARIAWGKALEHKPINHDAWYGYAEYCLYLGDHAEYLNARRQLIKTFGSTSDPRIAERTGRACLLLPLEGEELIQAVRLAELAGGVEPAMHAAYYPYFRFALGLARYRQGRFHEVMAVMKGDTSKVLRPAPQLVMAMTLHQTGRIDEANAILSEAIQSREWNSVEGFNPSNWVCHILRREAEDLILAKGVK